MGFHCTLLLLAAAQVVEDGCPTLLDERIDDFARGLFEAGEFHGGLLVADGGEVLYRQAFGMADRDGEVPNAPETRFPVHSITKPFTAVLVLQLVEEGALELAGTLGEHLPSFEHEAAGGITVHHLLCHTSGLPDYFLTLPGYLDCEEVDLPMEEALAAVAAMPLEFEPGSAFAYSNTGYVLLARIVEHATGSSYPDVLRERILDPLGMADTTWSAEDHGPGVARSYLAGGADVPRQRYFIGDGGIQSTVDDMHRFARALGSTELLSPETWDLAFQPHGLPADQHRPHPAHAFPYGYGFALDELPLSPGETARVALHGGAGCGGSALFQRFLDHDRIVVFWNNVGGIPPEMPGLLELLAAG